MKKTIFVLGAGKGCGNGVAEKFGTNDFRVILMARNAEHLAEYEKEFKDKGIEVYTKVTDAANFDSVTKSFNELKEKFGVPDVLFYNVGVTVSDADCSDEKNADMLMKRYQVDVAGAYHAIQQVVGEEFGAKNGAILITGGGLAMYPMDEYLPLSMDKAALRAMVQALSPIMKEKGIYIGTVQVTGTIGSNDFYAPKTIAEEFWKLYTGQDSFEIVH